MNPEFKREPEKTSIYIVMDSSRNNGPSSIVAVFSDHDNAKLFLADYVLEKNVYTNELSIVEKEVETALEFQERRKRR